MVHHSQDARRHVPDSVAALQAVFAHLGQKAGHAESGGGVDGVALSSGCDRNAERRGERLGSVAPVRQDRERRDGLDEVSAIEVDIGVRQRIDARRQPMGEVLADSSG